MISMQNNMLVAIPDYLPLSLQEFVRHFANLFSNKEYRDWIKYDEYTLLLGYSCRTLFDTCLNSFNKKDLVVLTTPLHHTSYRNIIENYTKLENIHVLTYNEDYNKIIKVPNVKKCDVVVITHPFGQDLDLTILTDFKKKHNCLIIEDRVQGGSLDRKFSHDIVDIAIYSMGMDKRPIALGGGYLFIRNKHENFFKEIYKNQLNLPEEKISKRFKELVKKIPTYLIYNVRPFLYPFMMVMKFLSFFSSDFEIVNVTKFYRKNNPGFLREEILFKPSKALMKSMIENSWKHKRIEELYAKKYEEFINIIHPKIRKYFFPWYKGNTLLTTYNAIFIDENLVEKFMSFMNDYDISTLANPTYKIFNKEYQGKAKDRAFNDGIVYLPSHVAMTQEEMEYLNNRLIEFYMKFIQKKFQF